MKIEVFNKEFLAMCEWFGRKPNETVFDVFYQQLRSLTGQQFITAVKWAYTTQQFMPTPQQLFDASGGGYDLDELWSQLITGSLELNEYRYDRNALFDAKHKLQKQLPDELNQFVEQNNISILELSNKSDFDQSQTRTSLKRFLDNKTPSEKSLKTIVPQLESRSGGGLRRIGSSK